MGFKEFDYALTDSQKEAEKKLIDALKKNTTVKKFMERYECPVEIIENNPYKFKTWLEDLSEINALTKEILEREPDKGGYVDLYYDKETNRLMDTYKIASLAQEVIKANEYLNNYLVFPINKRLQNSFFESMDLEKENPNYLKAINMMMKYLDNDKLGYYLFGDLGVGKSYLAASLTNKLAKEGEPVVFVSVADLLLHLKNNFSNSYENEKVMNSLKKAKLIVLDDIGAEPISTWGRDEVLLPLLNARLENNRKTIFTSNYRPEQLEELYAIDSRGNMDILRSKRFVDRIFAISEPYEIKGENRRHKRN